MKIIKNFVKFENVSGAIMSRSWKSKVMCLGSWERQECLAFAMASDVVRVKDLWFSNQPNLQTNFGEIMG